MVIVLHVFIYLKETQNIQQLSFFFQVFFINSICAQQWAFYISAILFIWTVGNKIKILNLKNQFEKFAYISKFKLQDF